MIKSPLNYTGNKFKLLNQIIPVFPKVQKFADVFCGGLNVGINADADIIFANDRMIPLIEMYEYFQLHSIDEILSEIESVVSFYSLSKTNQDGFFKLRNDYNANKDPLKLFVLSCYSFNNIIRFNNSFEFNSSFGKDKGSFNKNIKTNLIEFVDRLQSKTIVFSSRDFRELDYSSVDLVYCDPPYLISNAMYNDGKRCFGDWSKQDDQTLLQILDTVHQNGKMFALSNVIEHKGLVNEELKQWSKNYNTIVLNKTYSNCSYNLKTKNEKTVEVLITNFERNDLIADW
jgi:DNA adenine methylase